MADARLTLERDSPHTHDLKTHHRVLVDQTKNQAKRQLKYNLKRMRQEYERENQMLKDLVKTAFDGLRQHQQINNELVTITKTNASSSHDASYVHFAHLNSRNQIAIDTLPWSL